MPHQSTDRPSLVLSTHVSVKIVHLIVVLRLDRHHDFVSEVLFGHRADPKFHTLVQELSDQLPKFLVNLLGLLLFFSYWSDSESLKARVPRRWLLLDFDHVLCGHCTSREQFLEDPFICSVQ